MKQNHDDSEISLGDLEDLLAEPVQAAPVNHQHQSVLNNRNFQAPAKQASKALAALPQP